MASPVTVTVGHTVVCTYTILDQNGAPMLVQPPLDAPAMWTDTPDPAGADTNIVSADGTTDIVTAAAAGSDTVGLSVTIGGRTFADSLLITIAAAPQVASGVMIDAVVS